MWFGQQISLFQPKKMYAKSRGRELKSSKGVVAGNILLSNISELEL